MQLRTYSYIYFVARVFIDVAIWLNLLVSKFFHLVKPNHSNELTSS